MRTPVGRARGRAWRRCLWAALPLGYTLLGWHGLANAAALALLPLLLLYLAELRAGELDGRGGGGRAA